MSLSEFWLSVNTAWEWRSPVVLVDSPKLDASKIQSLINKAHIWLCTSAVEGFDERDFDFLSPDERSELVKNVESFRSVAEQVPEGGLSTSKQADEAMPAFARIVQILSPDKYSDPVAFRLGKIIERELGSSWPDWTKHLKFESFSDVGGDAALRVLVEVDDAMVNRPDFAVQSGRIREKISGVVRRNSESVWPYVQFRTASEQTSVEEANVQ